MKAGCTNYPNMALLRNHDTFRHLMEGDANNATASTFTPAVDLWINGRGSR